MADGILDGISNAVSGAGDFFLNRGRYADPNAMNAQFGVPEQDVRQAGINTLANVSSLLLAAGQPMTGSERAKLLAGIGPALGGMQTDIFKSTQARLMNAQQRGAMQEQQELQALNEERKRDPEGLAKKMGRTINEVQTLSIKDLREIAKSTIIRQASKTPGERELEAVNLQMAQRKLREPTIFRVGNQAYRFDEQGAPVAVGPAPDYGFGETEVPARPPAGVGVQPPDIARPAGAPPIPQQPAETNRFATINRDVDYNRAFGVSGAYNWAAGKLRGVVGSEDKATQEAGKAISEVNTLRNSLISATSAEVAGKNLKATQQRIQELLPTPAAVFTSPAEAVNKFSSVKSLIESDMNDLLFIGSERSNASPADKTKAAQAYRDLRRNRDNINVVIDGLTQETRPTAARPAQEQGGARFREGQTAVNRQTGARVIYRNGRWEPL
jgi:hypothetical protein